MKQVEADVVVVAAGTAGLTAALTAAQGGARVTMFEKAATTGGTGNMGKGLLAVESRLQRLKQVGLTREQAFKIFMDYTHWRVDARLVKAYIDRSANTIDWLEELGIEFVEPAAYFPGSNFTWHLIKQAQGRFGEVGASGNIMKILTDTARELGVEIFLETPAKKILKEGKRITGVIAEDKDGETIQANAKAVIIATGGFGDNPDMIKEYTGFEWGRDMFSFRIPGLTGDGMRMAWEAGAAKTDINMEMIYMLPGDPGPEIYTAFRQPNLLVNLLGERFISEEIMQNTTFTGNALCIQKNRCGFMIFDNAAKKHYEETGVDFVNIMQPVTKYDDLDANIKQALDQGNENVFVADTIEELAAQTGINPDGLRKTVDEYNQACETGRDELFNKNPRYLRPVKQPKFYAGRLFPGAYGSLGGIKINHKTEALTEDYEVIPGLYAAGTDACSIFGDSYVFVLPGNTMGFAVNSGRIAGENALAYVKTIG